MRSLPFYLLCFCTLFLFFTPLSAQDDDNPFATEEDAAISVDEGETVKELTVDENSETAELPFWYGYIHWQKKINDKLSDTMLDLKENFSLWKVILIFIISLIYSIVHTAGPGHGKTIIGTFFLTSDKKYRKSDAAMAGLIVSLTHIGTAFLLSFIFYIILKSMTAGSQSGDMSSNAKYFGGIMVIITGLVILISSHPAVKKMFESFEDKIPDFFKKKGTLVWFAILSGIVPCPLAWFVLLFSISYGIYGYGILSVVAMAIGAAITVGTTGALILHGKEKALSFMSLDKLTRVSAVLRFFGGCILIMLGLSMSFL